MFLWMSIRSTKPCGNIWVIRRVFDTKLLLDTHSLQTPPQHHPSTVIIWSHTARGKNTGGTVACVVLNGSFCVGVFCSWHYQSNLITPICFEEKMWLGCQHLVECIWHVPVDSHQLIFLRARAVPVIYCLEQSWERRGRLWIIFPLPCYVRLCSQFPILWNILLAETACFLFSLKCFLNNWD